MLMGEAIAKPSTAKRGRTELVQGSRAIALGALEAGVSMVTSYPGTPATEILDYVQREADESTVAEWCVNEKVALETAAGASIAGQPAMCVMKHYGLNVAADALAALALADCCIGGLVVVVGDDPHGHASRSEQDSRYYAKLLQVPVLELSTIETAAEVVKYAFALSKKQILPVIVRAVTRMLHTHVAMTLPERQRPVARMANVPTNLKIFSSPAAHYNGIVKRKLEQCKALFETSGLNHHRHGDGAKLLAICCGRSYALVLEACDRLGTNAIDVLQLTTVWPLPAELIRKTVTSYRAVAFFEEVEPFVESEVLALVGESPARFASTEFLGKFNGRASGQEIPGVSELSLEAIMRDVASFLSNRRPSSPEVQEGVSPQRISGTLCAGCPHRAAFFSIKQVRDRSSEPISILGDVGCYTMGLGATGYNVLQSALCMGSSVAMASGLSRLDWGDASRKVIAVIGDSTLLHAGIPALIDLKEKEAPVTVVVLDNAVSAMTGGQRTPTWQQGGKVNRIEAMMEAIDIPYRVVDAMQVVDNIMALRDALSGDGPHALIFRAPCILFPPTTQTADKKLTVDEELCIGEGCGCNLYCVTAFQCPALTAQQRNGRLLANINQSACTDCGACAFLCPADAIVPVKVPAGDALKRTVL